MAPRHRVDPGTSGRTSAELYPRERTETRRAGQADPDELLPPDHDVGDEEIEEKVRGEVEDDATDVRY